MSKTLFPTTSAEGAKENRLKNCNALENQTTRRILPVVPAMALALAFAFSLPQLARAEPIHVGNVPFNIKVPAGNHAFLVGHGVGTQNYVCAPSASSPTGVAYALFTPQATLFNDDSKQLITHFFSPSPSETNTNPAVVSPGGAIRVTWQHRDTSTIWAKLHQSGKDGNGAVTVDTKAVAWLLLDKVGVQKGPTGGDTLTKTTFVQRLNTTGGLAPKTGCSSLTDVGNQAFVPYTADYFFYQKAN